MSRLDFLPYPPTSFPYRDLLVLEQLPLGPNDEVCEIGVGSGATTARMARICARVTGFEISEPTVRALAYLEERHKNLRLVVADVTKPSALGPWQGAFSRLVACDTLEHVDSPAAFFVAAERLLAPGGELLVTFPNEPKAVMHGVTRFDEVAELSSLLDRAGLTSHCIGAARLSPKAEAIAENLGWRPLRTLRSLMGRGKAKRTHGQEASAGDAPQTFEETDFYKKMRLYRHVAPAVNLYWYAVLKLMDKRGPAFVVDWDFRDVAFTDCQVLIRAKKAP